MASDRSSTAAASTRPSAAARRRRRADTTFRTVVLSRFFALLWWLFVLGFTAMFVASAVDLVVHRTWRAAINTALITAFCIPIAREWPNWRRMGRMLVRGV